MPRRPRPKGFRHAGGKGASPVAPVFTVPQRTRGCPDKGATPWCVSADHLTEAGAGLGSALVGISSGRRYHNRRSRSCPRRGLRAGKPGGAGRAPGAEFHTFIRMSLSAFGLIVAAACLHACWNLTAKRVSGNLGVLWLGLGMAGAVLAPFAVSSAWQAVAAGPLEEAAGRFTAITSRCCATMSGPADLLPDPLCLGSRERADREGEALTVRWILPAVVAVGTAVHFLWAGGPNGRRSGFRA